MKKLMLNKLKKNLNYSADTFEKVKELVDKHISLVDNQFVLRDPNPVKLILIQNEK